MGYSDQKYYARPMELMGQSASLVGTLTASSTANAIAAAAYRIPKFIKRTKVVGGKFVVKTASTTGQQVISLLNGTNTFATATNTSTNNAGTELTLSVTAANATFAADSGITVAVAGTATASGDSFGAFDLWTENQEQFS